MKHTFAMRVHNDLELALKSTALLRRHWCERSGIIVYYDGKDKNHELLEQLDVNVDLLILKDHEERESQSIINAINSIVEECGNRGTEIASFLFADMIPLFPEAWNSFLERFDKSGKYFTYVPTTVKGPLIDLHHLHLNIPGLSETEYFPFKIIGYPSDVPYDFAEYHMSYAFALYREHWKEESYPMWNVTFEQNQAQGVHPYGVFPFRSFNPESSMIATDSEDFWMEYNLLSVFDKDLIPISLPIAP